MPYQGTPLVVTATDRQTLERWSRSGRTERRRADRARLVLGAAEGQGDPCHRAPAARARRDRE